MVASALKKGPPSRSAACLGLLLATSLVALSPNAAAARTWHVPGDATSVSPAQSGSKAEEINFYTTNGADTIRTDVPVYIQGERLDPPHVIAVVDSAATLDGRVIFSPPVIPGTASLRQALADAPAPLRAR